MKKSLSIITISLLLLACSGNKKEATLESILNTGDIKAINQKRQVLIDKQVIMVKYKVVRISEFEKHIKSFVENNGIDK